MRGPRTRQRGAALLIAITSIAILTAVAVDLAYNTRVSLQMAANARDELRATYLAKSGVALSRLVLPETPRRSGRFDLTGALTSTPRLRRPSIISAGSSQQKCWTASAWPRPRPAR